MSELDLEKGLSEFLAHTREAFLSDSGYAEAIARQAMTLEVARRLVDDVD